MIRVWVYFDEVKSGPENSGAYISPQKKKSFINLRPLPSLDIFFRAQFTISLFFKWYFCRKKEHFYSHFILISIFPLFSHSSFFFFFSFFFLSFHFPLSNGGRGYFGKYIPLENDLQPLILWYRKVWFSQGSYSV